MATKINWSLLSSRETTILLSLVLDLSFSHRDWWLFAGAPATELVSGEWVVVGSATWMSCQHHMTNYVDHNMPPGVPCHICYRLLLFLFQNCLFDR